MENRKSMLPSLSDGRCGRSQGRSSEPPGPGGAPRVLPCVYNMAEYIGYEWKADYGYDYVPKKRPVDRDGAVKALRERVGASLDLALRDKSKCQDDRFLERFLYARKHDVHEAFTLLVSYYSYRQKHPELFENLSGEDLSIERALADGLPGVLEHRDRRGRCVLVMFASNWSPAACSLTAVYRALLLTLEKASEDVQNLANGFVIVVDWTEFSFKQSAHMNPKILKLMIEGLQDCFPARFKGIHFIAQPWYVETALAVIKPFLKGKTKERIHLHGYNLSTLHEHLTKDILPSDLGGEGPSHNTEEWLAKVAPHRKAKDEDDDASPCRIDKAKIDRGYKKYSGRTRENGLKDGLLKPDDEL